MSAMDLDAPVSIASQFSNQVQTGATYVNPAFAKNLANNSKVFSVAIAALQ